MNKYDSLAVLTFFGLSSIEDIFEENFSINADYDKELVKLCNTNICTIISVPIYSLRKINSIANNMKKNLPFLYNIFIIFCNGVDFP
jgi:hypothetical protein